MNKVAKSVLLGLMVMAVGGVNAVIANAAAPAADYVDVKPAGYHQMIDGKQVNLYTLKNKNGMVAKFTNYGGKLVEFLAPDRNGKLGDIALGYETLDAAKKGQLSAGCTIGRYANRIGKGKFTLDGKEYQLSINNGINHLHGGTTGSRVQVFDAKQLNGKTLQMHLLFKDGQDGYPGNCNLTATYKLTDDNSLVCIYEATTDKPTIVNFCNHAFWNLNGAGNGDILGHEMTLYADNFTPVDSTLITTGEIRSVKGTDLDFTVPHKIGERINGSYEQIKFGPGYDFNFVINKVPGQKMNHAATVYAPESGRVMDVYTTEPGIQFYSGNFFNGAKDIGKGGKHYVYRGTFALETQKFPDSPNKPAWPSPILRPGQKFTSETIYKFSTK